jgi:hypothetical protein
MLGLGALNLGVGASGPMLQDRHGKAGRDLEAKGQPASQPPYALEWVVTEKTYVSGSSASLAGECVEGLTSNEDGIDIARLMLARGDQTFATARRDGTSRIYCYFVVCVPSVRIQPPLQ